MRSFSRALVIAAFALPIGACSSTGDFDPGELSLFEWLSTKKPLPGERKAVFPEGVPGVSKGIPPELVKGNQPQFAELPEAELPTEPVAIVE
jgi:hypothetical protein